MSYAPRILIVEDEPSVRALFEEILSGDGYYMTAVGTAGQALYPIRNFEFDLIILDRSLPDSMAPNCLVTSVQNRLI